jgi:protein-S-isoprenylcysteine O-methyltransferase Ste14
MPDALFVFLAALGYGALHSVLASRWVKDAVRKGFGPITDRFYRLCYNAVAGITLIPLLAVLGRNIGPVLVRVPWPWWAVMGTLQIAGLMLLLASFLQSDPSDLLGLRQMGNADGAEARLHTTGVNGWVRHPMYTFGLLALWCFPIITTGTLAFSTGITLYVIIGSELEERRLIAQFGGEYIRYRSKVARLIPFIF